MSGDQTFRLCAVLRIDNQMLARLLQLPPEAEITAAACPHDSRGVIELRIEGAGYPTREGERIRAATGIVQAVKLARDRELVQIGWPFSNEDAAA